MCRAARPWYNLWMAPESQSCHMRHIQLSSYRKYHIEEKCLLGWNCECETQSSSTLVDTVREWVIHTGSCDCLCNHQSRHYYQRPVSWYCLATELTQLSIDQSIKINQSMLVQVFVYFPFFPCNLTKICSEKSSMIQTTYYTASFRRSAVLLTSSVLAHITESYLTVSRALQILISLHICYFITLIDLCACFLFCVSTIVQLRSDSMLINGYVMFVSAWLVVCTCIFLREWSHIR